MEKSPPDIPARLESSSLSPGLPAGKMFLPHNFSTDITEVWKE